MASPTGVDPTAAATTVRAHRFLPRRFPAIAGSAVLGVVAVAGVVIVRQQDVDLGRAVAAIESSTTSIAPASAVPTTVAVVITVAPEPVTATTAAPATTVEVTTTEVATTTSTSTTLPATTTTVVPYDPTGTWRVDNICRQCGTGDVTATGFDALTGTFTLDGGSETGSGTIVGNQITILWTDAGSAVPTGRYDLTVAPDGQTWTGTVVGTAAGGPVGTSVFTRTGAPAPPGPAPVVVATTSPPAGVPTTVAATPTT